MPIVHLFSNFSITINLHVYFVIAKMVFHMMLAGDLLFLIFFSGDFDQCEDDLHKVGYLIGISECYLVAINV